MKHNRVGRFIYILILLVVSLLAWVFFNLPAWIDSAHYLTALSGFHGCNASISNTSTTHVADDKTVIQWLLEHEFGEKVLTVPQRLCFGSLSAYRVFFGLALFHAIFAVFMIGAENVRKTLRYEIQHGWWVIKMGLLAIFIASGFLLLDDHIILVFSWIAFGGSLLFLLIQIVLLIEFAHITTAKIASAALPPPSSDTGSDQDTASHSRVSCFLVGSGAAILILLAYMASLVFLVLAYMSASCSVVSTGTTVTLLLILIVSFLGFLAMKTQRGGLLPASIACLSAAYLTWSAFTPMALQDLQCINPTAAMEALSGSNTTLNHLVHFASLHELSRDAQHIILLGAAMVALAYATVRTSATAERLHPVSDSNPVPRNMDETNTFETDDEGGIELPVQDDAPYSYTWFHFILLLATFYASMVLTGWNQLSSVSTVTGSHAVVYANGTSGSAWVKLVSAWVTLVLYNWTVYVPFIRARCCHRQATPAQV